MVGGIIVLLAIPLYVLLTAPVFKINVSPAEITPVAVIKSSTTGTFVFGDRVMLFTGQAGIEVSASGYESFYTTLQRLDSRILDVVLTPKPGVVELIVDAPREVEIRVDGVRLAVGLTLTAELAAGTHEVELIGSGIHDFSETIEVEGKGKEQQFTFQPSLANSYLSLQTDPPDATVQLDGVEVDNPSENSLIGVGPHNLLVAAPNHESVTLSFRSELDGLVDLGTLTLKKLPVELDIRTSPDNVAIMQGNDFLGTTNTKIHLLPDIDHQLVLRRANYVDKSFDVKGSAGEKIRKHFTMESLPVTVNVRSNVEANVVVNGVQKGVTPITLSLVDQDQLLIDRDGHVPVTKVIRTALGKQQNLNVELLTIEAAQIKSSPTEVKLSNYMTLKKFEPWSYTMQEVKEGWFDSEKTQNTSAREIRVSITRPFYISTTEVTIEDFEQFQSQQNSGNTRLPVTNVSWADAAKFCNWLSTKYNLPHVYQFSSGATLQEVDESALGYRLPTELEWLAVYSSDPSTQGKVELYPWGQSSRIPRAFGNFAGREAIDSLPQFDREYIDNHAGIAPVGSYAANKRGLHDLAGNVSEWLHDFYANWPNANSLTNYTGPRFGLDHVVRGGNYTTVGSDILRSSARSFVSGKDSTVGFRVARWIY